MAQLIDEQVLQPWARSHEPADGRTGNNGRSYWSQIMFVRDELTRLFWPTWEAQDAHPVTVVGEHVSTSILLPVYSIRVPDVLEVRLRGNFSDWVVSVASGRPVTANFYDLFDPTARQKPVYSEGFDPDWVFGPYADNPQNFSFTTPTQYHLYTFCFLLTSALELRS